MSLRSFLCNLLSCHDFCPPPGPVGPPVTGGPRVAVIDRSTVGLGLPAGKALGDLVRAMQHYVDTMFAPEWGTPCTLFAAPDLVPGAWALILIDDADVANALGYHDLTDEGLPLGKVFVRTTRAAGEAVSVTASHELVEMLVDPSINLLATGVIRVQDVYAYETADAVEDTPFVRVDGIDLSNFVLPAYFEDFHGAGARYDFLGVLHEAFSLAPGGYAAIMVGGRWTQIFGSQEKAARFAREDRRDHRTELRQRRAQGEQLRASARHRRS